MDLKEEKLSRAIGAFSRRRILRLLINKEMNVKDISDSLGLSVSLTSRHLKLLYDLGFLKVREEYPYKYYSLKIKKIRDLLISYDKVLERLQ